MTAEHDRLRASLRDLAEIAEPTDLYDRALHRSRRIARREAAVGTGAALLVLGVLASGLWRMPHRPETAVPAAAGPASPTGTRPSWSATSIGPAPTTAGAPANDSKPTGKPSRADRVPVRAGAATPRSRALADMPGHVFYQGTGAEPDVVRLSPADGDTETVLPDAPSPVGVSPDGSRIAYVSGGRLLVGEARGDAPAQQVAEGVVTTAQAPAWSPQGDRLLVAIDAPAVLDLASGAITPLPGDLGEGQHFRWSGDGSKLVYATEHCGLEVAGTDADSGTTVPVLGNTRPRDNPDRLAACKATSVDATGERVTVPLQTTGESAAGTETADAVIDTATGEPERLPVGGSVIGAVFDAEGNLLVRTRTDGRTRLSLFAPDNTLRVQAVEPAAVRDLALLAYTR